MGQTVLSLNAAAAGGVGLVAAGRLARGGLELPRLALAASAVRPEAATPLR